MDFSFSDLNFNSVETLPGYQARAAFIAIFTKGACLYTMRAALGFAACQSKKAQQ